MPARLQEVLTLEVPLIVQIAECQMPLGGVLDLVPGAIVELGKPADEELEVRVNNKVIGLGTAVKVGENFGIRLTYIGNVLDRIASLGKGSSESSSESPEAVADRLLAG